MRLFLNVFMLVLLASLDCFTQDVARLTPDSSVVAAARAAAIAALNFRQGDAAGFQRARAAFSTSGWTEFLKKMAGFLDANGAPTFTSTFVARETKVLGEQDGILHLKIPGSLTQTNQLGTTTYSRFAVDLYVVHDGAENKIRIQRLEQLTCLGASTECN